MTELSDVRKRILHFIDYYSRQTGCRPPIREICREVGLQSRTSVYEHLGWLETRGYIGPWRGVTVYLPGTKECLTCHGSGRVR